MSVFKRRRFPVEIIVSVRTSPLDEIECVYFRGVHLFFSGHLKSVSKRLVRIGSEEMVQDSRAGVPVCG
jgi:hypothetical protein